MTLHVPNDETPKKWFTAVGLIEFKMTNEKNSIFFLTLNFVVTFTIKKSAVCLQMSDTSTTQVSMENISRKLIHFTDNTWCECVSEIKAFSLPSSYFCYCKTYAYSYYIPSHCGKNSKSKKILWLFFQNRKNQEEILLFLGKWILIWYFFQIRPQCHR